MSQSSQMQPSGPPYPSTAAGLGGLPTIIPDVPVSAVFVALYLTSAITNIVIFKGNLKKGHKFLLQILLIAFSMSRVATLVLRIAWATRERNFRLAIAAQIFVNAGILILYILNMILSQRILRAKQPRLGWNPLLRLLTKAFYIGIAAALVMVITTVVLSLYTLDTRTRQICRDVQLAALTYLLVFTCIPLLQVGAAVLLPKSKQEETFGQGSMRSKSIIVITSTCLCILSAGFKAAANWSPPRPASNPAWYHSKPCFYIFNFSLEILILLLLTANRIDKRFFIPNGCKGPGDYTRLAQETQSDAKSVYSQGAETNA